MLIVLLFLTSCANFEGLRSAHYDGDPVTENELAIKKYHDDSEIIDKEKEYYIRYSLSKDILKPSLDYSHEEAFLLEDGQYIIGEDLPAGRVSLLGNESIFTSENYDVHVGNMIIRDEQGDIYFENLFHSAYGVLVSQLDFIDGHEIEVIGKESQITVFYSEDFPDNPYELMELPELIQNLGQEDLLDPIRIFENGETINLRAGIYEVGRHLESGQYEVRKIEAPHHTEMYIFRKNIDPQVIELLQNKPNNSENEKQDKATNVVKIELKDGDKIYLQLVNNLELKLLE